MNILLLVICSASDLNSPYDELLETFLNGLTKISRLLFTLRGHIRFEFDKKRPSCTSAILYFLYSEEIYIDGLGSNVAAICGQ